MNSIVKVPPLYPIIDFSCFVAQPDPIWAVVRYAEELIAAGATLIQLRDKSQPEQPRRFLSCARELRRVTWGAGTTPRATLIINDRVDLCLAADADGVHLGQDDLSPESARRIFDSVLSHPISWSPGKSQLLRERMGHPGESSVESSESHPIARSLGKSQLLGERMGHSGESSDREKIGRSEKSSGREETGHREGSAVEGREMTRKLLIGFSTHSLAQVRAADTLPVDYIAIGPVFATGSKANPDPVVGLDGVRQARRVTQKPLVAIGGITRLNCSQVKAAGADAVAVISDLLESPAKAVADFLRVLG
jgi:thiamine monophosphate synthase